MTNKALVNHGLRACRASGYVRPVSAGQFCKWAWESAQVAAGIPSLARGKVIIERKFQDKNFNLTGAEYFFWLQLNRGELMRSSFEKVNSLALAAIEKTIDYWKAGNHWPVPVAPKNNQVEFDGNRNKPLTQKDREKSRERMRQIMGSL